MFTGKFFWTIEAQALRTLVCHLCLCHREPGGESLLGTLVVAVCCKCVAAGVDGLESVARVR
jgi:hypothetical protein